jgi:hypothetical protein
MAYHIERVLLLSSFLMEEKSGFITIQFTETMADPLFLMHLGTKCGVVTERGIAWMVQLLRILLFLPTSGGLMENTIKQRKSGRKHDALQ